MTAPKDPSKLEEWHKHMRDAKIGSKNPFFGRHHNEETLQKIGSVRRGKHHTKESLERMSESHKGAIPSEETREKMSAAHMGNKCSLGFHQSEETKIKRGQAIKQYYIDHPEARLHAGETHAGPKSHLWKGGVSFEPYCPKFTREFKERVRAFFGYKCVECGVSQNGEKLGVHHVNFRKDACCSEDAIPLFVSLCRSCHSETNHNREYWQQHFTELINTHYGGKCYFSKEEMVEFLDLH